MRDKFYDLAIRPDCVMAVTGDNGGSWLSPIREDGPQPSVIPAASGQPWAIGSGMLTPNNMAERFYFPANATHVSCATPLDFRGSTSSFTFFADVELDDGWETTQQTKFWALPLLCEGYPLSTYAENCVGFTMLKNSASDAWMCDVLISNASKMITVLGNIQGLIKKRMRLAFTRDVTAKEIRLFVDGARLRTVSNDAVADPLNSSSPVSYGASLHIGAKYNGLSTEVGYTIHSAAVFNRALTDEEIADM